MTESGAKPTTDGSEVDMLRARIAELEQDRAELQVRANRAIAAAEDKSYWLDRWNLDLNALMRRPGASQFRAGLRVTRSVARSVRRVTRRARDRG